MQQPHLITSIGRAATAWLARCLEWDHEPKHFSKAAVSPTHLHLLSIGKWKLPRNTKVAVITRNPEAQVLSVVNRWRGMGNWRVREISWLKHLDGYLTKLDELVIAGAGVMSYEKMTHCPKCLLSELRGAGIEEPVSFIVHRYNTFPKAVTKLDPTMKGVAARLQKHYARWHDAKA